MDFGYTQEQHDLRELAGRLLGQRFTDEHRKAFSRSGEAYDAPLWDSLAQAGLLGTAIAAERGGSGLGLTELCLLLEEQGRTLAAVPLLETLLLGALPIERFGTPAQRQLLPAVAAGEMLLTAALEEPPGTAPAQHTRAERTASGWRVSGVKTCVPYAAQAAYLLVPAQEGARTRVFLIARDSAGLEVQAQRGTSATPLGQVSLSGVRLAGDALLGGEAEADVAAWIGAWGRLGRCALQLGVSEEALRRAVAYTRERQQFGRPLGSFQAVQHRLADCYIDTEALRSTYLRAVWALDQGLAAPAELLAASWWAAQCGHRVTHAVQHVHGGLGADVEYPVHAFFLRAKELELDGGGALATLAELGQVLHAGSVRPFTANP